MYDGIYFKKTNSLKTVSKITVHSTAVPVSCKEYKKMLAYMIYEKAEGEKNQGFIEMFQKEGVRHGISFLFITKAQYQDKKLPDLVLNRTRDYKVSLWYEERGIPILHSSALVKLGNDKWDTFCYLKHFFSNNSGKDVNLLLPDTIYCSTFCLEEFYQNVITKQWHKGENLVLKTVDGHGGNEVMLITAEFLETYFYNERNYNDLESETFKNVFQIFLGKKCIVQEQIKSRSMDVRVYIVGNQIYHGILRKGEKDFRSNFSLGGSVTEYFFSDSEKKRIGIFLNAFSDFIFGLAGLDFIVTEDGRLVFNELEEMAGCRMLYACTKKDIVKDYVSWITEQDWK